MIDLKNKIIMISGANRGIGYATAKLLKEKGCILSLAARNPDEIKVGGDNVLKCMWDAKEKNYQKIGCLKLFLTSIKLTVWL